MLMFKHKSGQFNTTTANIPTAFRTASESFLPPNATAQTFENIN